MPLDNPKAGYNYAVEFQSSAIPWVLSGNAPASGSATAPVQFEFPRVSRYITISNRDVAYSGSLSIGFTRNGILSGNRFVVQGGQTQTFDLRVKTIFIQSESTASIPYTLSVGLTNIQTYMMPTLTGTLGDGTAGWQGVG